MTRSEKTKPGGGNLRASEITTAWESDSRAESSPEQAATLTLALTATDAARGQLSRYAGMTDTPADGVVEAADLLDAARVMLARVVTP